eukprot:666102-Prymnesium_polylepis.1
MLCGAGVRMRRARCVCVAVRCIALFTCRLPLALPGGRRTPTRSECMSRIHLPTVAFKPAPRSDETDS